MKTNSIFFKIKVAFAISVFLIFSVFALVYAMEARRQDMELHQRAMQAARTIKHLSDDDAPRDLIESRLKEFDFALPQDEEAQKILTGGHPIMQFDRMGPVTIGRYEFEHKKYLVIQGKERIDVLEDKKTRSSLTLVLTAALLTVLSVLAMFYRSILNNLKPLRELKHRVEAFAKSGELTPASKNLCDEIESVSGAFDKTATHLNNISRARSLFLRNIAHELKTPLSKGRFLVEMLKEEELKERFENLFIRFEVIIGELLAVERLTSGGLTLNKKEYSLNDILAEAIDTAFLDDENIEMPDIETTVTVDFKLFAIALKNLLDNGVKFSEDKKVTVDFDGKTLSFSNTGEPMSQNFELLGEAFVKGDESADGLGLGLYIVRQILDAHGAKIEYEYNNGIHTFKINMENISCKS